MSSSILRQTSTLSVESLSKITTTPGLFTDEGPKPTDRATFRSITDRDSLGPGRVRRFSKCSRIEVRPPLLESRSVSATRPARLDPTRGTALIICDSVSNHTVFVIYLFDPSVLLSRFWTSRGHRWSPLLPLDKCVLSLLSRIQDSAFPPLVDFHQVLLTHALALSVYRYQSSRKKKSPYKKSYVHSVTIEPASLLSVGTRTTCQATGGRGLHAYSVQRFRTHNTSASAGRMSIMVCLACIFTDSTSTTSLPLRNFDGMLFSTSSKDRMLTAKTTTSRSLAKKSEDSNCG